MSIRTLRMEAGYVSVWEIVIFRMRTDRNISLERRSLMKITDECIACGTCVESCPVGAIVESDEIFMITEDCTDCGACESSCPVDAIVE